MPVLSINLSAFNCSPESPKSHNAYFVACIWLCVLLLTQFWNSCRKLTQLFLFDFRIYVHSTNTLPWGGVTNTAPWEGRKDWKEKEPSFFFCVIIFSVSGWLVQGNTVSEQWSDSLVMCVCRTPAPSFCSGMTVCTPSYLVLDAASSPCTCVSLAEGSHVCVSMIIMCLWAIMDLRGDEVPGRLPPSGYGYLLWQVHALLPPWALKETYLQR